MSETKEAATCRKIPLTVNCGNLSPVYADAPETVIRRKDDLPVLVLGETVVFCLTFLDGNGDKMVFQSGDTFELSADVDYDRSYTVTEKDANYRIVSEITYDAQGNPISS